MRQASGRTGRADVTVVGGGLGMAPLFPLTVSVLAAATAATRSRTAGWVLGCGGLGGAALPWLTGRLGGGPGALNHGFLVPLAGLAGLAALYGVRHVWGE
jgi:fucose permease